MRLGVTRATAIAAINAVVQHLELGLFMSELKIVESALNCDPKDGNVRACEISGRTNNNTSVDAHCILMPKDNLDEICSFPFKRIIVIVNPLFSRFELDITEKGLEVTPT